MARRFGKNDGIFFGVLLLVLIVGFAWHSVTKEGGDFVKVTVNGQLYGTYSLKKDRTVDIVTPEAGRNELKIERGRADMVDASCPDRLCVHQRAVSKAKETIVCLPNKVVVEVVGGDGADLDAVTARMPFLFCFGSERCR